MSKKRKKSESLNLFNDDLIPGHDILPDVSSIIESVLDPLSVETVDELLQECEGTLDVVNAVIEPQIVSLAVNYDAIDDPQLDDGQVLLPCNGSTDLLDWIMQQNKDISGEDASWYVRAYTGGDTYGALPEPDIASVPALLIAVLTCDILKACNLLSSGEYEAGTGVTHYHNMITLQTLLAQLRDDFPDLSTNFCDTDLSLFNGLLVPALSPDLLTPTACILSNRVGDAHRDLFHLRNSYVLRGELEDGFRLYFNEVSGAMLIVGRSSLCHLGGTDIGARDGDLSAEGLLSLTLMASAIPGAECTSVSAGDIALLLIGRPEQCLRHMGVEYTAAMLESVPEEVIPGLTALSKVKPLKRLHVYRDVYPRVDREDRSARNKRRSGVVPDDDHDVAGWFRQLGVLSYAVHHSDARLCYLIGARLIGIPYSATAGYVVEEPLLATVGLMVRSCFRVRTLTVMPCHGVWDMSGFKNGSRKGHVWFTALWLYRLFYGGTVLPGVPACAYELPLDDYVEQIGYTYLLSLHLTYGPEALDSLLTDLSTTSWAGVMRSTLHLTYANSEAMVLAHPSDLIASDYQNADTIRNRLLSAIFNTVNSMMPFDVVKCRGGVGSINRSPSDIKVANRRASEYRSFLEFANIIGGSATSLRHPTPAWQLLRALFNHLRQTT